MADYFAMDVAALQQEHDKLNDEYARFKAMGLGLDMSRGKPEPAQLDISLDMLKEMDYKDADGVDARNYGPLDGLPEAKRFFAEMLGASEEETFVAGNSSLQLMYSILEMAYRKGFPESDKPWKDYPKVRFLCPSPGYDRHFAISENFGFELIYVPMTPTGPDMDMVEELAQDETVKGIWCIPVYSNPDGYIFSDETVKRLAKMETAADFKIFWDNAYCVHNFTEDDKTCLNILDECRNVGNENRPLMFCSTSKITFAGGGVGAMSASAKNIDAVKKHLFFMTIGFDKMNQLRHVRYLKNMNGVAQHMKKHAVLLAPKFKKVVEILQNQLKPKGDIARWTNPKGGYFISLFVMDGCAKRVVQLCKDAGVVLTGAGAAFPYGEDPADSHIRIAPTFPSIEELETATQLLCLAARLAATEKLLKVR